MRALDFVLSFSEKKKKISDKEVLRKIRILVPARGADVKPPLGPTLGQFGVNIKDFCEKFNVKTKIFDEDILVNTQIILFVNKSYNFIIKTPPVFFLVNEDDILEESFSSAQFIFLSTFFKIVQLKSRDVNNVSLEAFARSILGTLSASNLFFVNDVFSD